MSAEMPPGRAWRLGQAIDASLQGVGERLVVDGERLGIAGVVQGHCVPECAGMHRAIERCTVPYRLDGLPQSGLDCLPQVLRCLAVNRHEVLDEADILGLVERGLSCSEIEVRQALAD